MLVSQKSPRGHLRLAGQADEKRSGLGREQRELGCGISGVSPRVCLAAGLPCLPQLGHLQLPTVLRGLLESSH